MAIAQSICIHLALAVDQGYHKPNKDNRNRKRKQKQKQKQKQADKKASERAALAREDGRTGRSCTTTAAITFSEQLCANFLVPEGDRSLALAWSTHAGYS